MGAGTPLLSRCFVLLWYGMRSCFMWKIFNCWFNWTWWHWTVVKQSFLVTLLISCSLFSSLLSPRVYSGFIFSIECRIPTMTIQRVSTIFDIFLVKILVSNLSLIWNLFLSHVEPWNFMVFDRFFDWFLSKTWTLLHVTNSYTIKTIKPLCNIVDFSHDFSFQIC